MQVCTHMCMYPSYTDNCTYNVYTLCPYITSSFQKRWRKPQKAENPLKKLKKQTFATCSTWHAIIYIQYEHATREKYKWFMYMYILGTDNFVPPPPPRIINGELYIVIFSRKRLAGGRDFKCSSTTSEGLHSTGLIKDTFPSWRTPKLLLVSTPFSASICNGTRT